MTDAGVEGRLALLTPKERECLRLAADNRSSKQIARELGIGQTSVDTHIRRAREKLGIRDRYEAAQRLVAWERGEPASAPPLPVEPVGFHIPPLSRFNFVQRLGLIVAAAVISALVFGVILTAMAAL